jgi:hypothetical protein
MDNVTTFVDNVGRVIIGQKTKPTNKGVLTIKEPAVVNVQVNQQNGQISVQLLPFIFREFIQADVRDAGVEWDFNLSNIVTSENVVLDDTIVNQYKNVFTKPVGTATLEKKDVVSKEPELVKLFDDED